MLKALKTLAVLLTATVMLAACGVRGSLDAPPGSAPSGDGAEVSDGEGGKKRHDKFVLDGLLR
jgi:predicted small lipoprotein YifL